MRPSPTGLSGRGTAPGDRSVEEGQTFLEILAAQREARGDVDSETAGNGTQPWCEARSSSDCEGTFALAERDQTVSESIGEPTAGEAARRNKPRMVGQSMLEYALIVILLAIVVIVLLGTVGHQTQDLFSNLSRGLAT